jgi:phosphate transport system permease protein
MKIPLSEFLLFWSFRIITFLTVGVLLLVLVLLWQAGSDVISWQFLTEFWSHRDITAGGIFPAILGSLYLGLGVALVSFPLGFATAVFLTEYSKNSVSKRVVEIAIRNLAGVPSVVYGLFGFAVFVSLMGMKSSLIAAILTLSIMTLPWIITASVEALEAIPNRFRESSLALGATRWGTIRDVIFPAALPGAITGAIIGLARALGETAPIIIVGATFYLATLPTSPFDQFMALPYHAFILATQHASPDAGQYAAATSLVLIILTFLLSMAAIIVRYLYRRKKDW